MNIWIVYDSKFGNNIKVAKTMGEMLKTHEVHVSYAKKVSPKDVLASKPDILLFGGPRRIGKIARTIRVWVEKFAKLAVATQFQLKKVGAWETRGVLNEKDAQSESGMERRIYNANLKTGDQWKALIQELPVATPAPDLLSLFVVDPPQKDPTKNEMAQAVLEDHATEKIQQFIGRNFP